LLKNNEQELELLNFQKLIFNHFQKLVFHQKIAAPLKVPPGALGPIATPLTQCMEHSFCHEASQI